MSLKCIFLMVFLVLVCNQGNAADRGEESLGKPKHISLERAVSSVKKRTKGRLLSAKTVRIQGERTHVIKLLTQGGHVKKVLIPRQPISERVSKQMIKDGK